VHFAPQKIAPWWYRPIHMLWFHGVVKYDDLWEGSCRWRWTKSLTKTWKWCYPQTSRHRITGRNLLRDLWPRSAGSRRQARAIRDRWLAVRSRRLRKSLRRLQRKSCAMASLLRTQGGEVPITKSWMHTRLQSALYPGRSFPSAHSRYFRIRRSSSARSRDRSQGDWVALLQRRDWCETNASIWVRIPIGYCGSLASGRIIQHVSTPDMGKSDAHR